MTLDVMHRAPINNEVNYDEFEMISARIEDGSLLVSDYDHLFTYTDNIIERTVFHIDSSVVKKCLGLESGTSEEDLLIAIRDKFHGDYDEIVTWLKDNNIDFEAGYSDALEESEERQGNTNTNLI